MTTLNSKNIIIDGKSIGAMTEQPTDRVYLGIEVSKKRAEYLIECLERPLCLGCHREDAECDADPCIDKQIELGELVKCKGCNHYFDPHHLTDGKCPDCGAEPRLFAVRVSETITYSGWIKARSHEEADKVIDYLDINDWQPMLESCEFKKYGYDITERRWDIDDPSASERDMCADSDIVIEAKDWIDQT